MEKSELLKTLEAVRSELANSKKVDDETRRSLTSLTDEIRRLTEEDEKTSAEHIGPLSSQVQDLVLQFETEHPALTTALNQVAAALANLGI